MTPMPVFVERVGLLGPGLPGWSASRTMLHGAAPYTPAEVTLPRLDILPAAERRRTGLSVKLALACGLDALAGSRREASALATVFTSSGGDGQVLHEICETLAGPDRQLSPTRFHNSVHNAPAGYWSIATQSREASTSLCGYDWSFGAGLVEAAAQVIVDREAVLLVSFDLPYPEPMGRVRRIYGALGVALLLTRTASDQCMARMTINIDGGGMPSRTPEPELERLRTGNPTGHALPLLAALAGDASAAVRLPYIAQQTLEIEITPFSGQEPD